jgi:hypothetical protein
MSTIPLWSPKGHQVRGRQSRELNHAFFLKNNLLSLKNNSAIMTQR